MNCFRLTFQTLLNQFLPGFWNTKDVCILDLFCILILYCVLSLFVKVYEARLFRLNKSNDGGLITSAEEAIDLQKKKSALNQFYWKLSQADKNSALSKNINEDDGKRRDVGEKVMVSYCCLLQFEQGVFSGFPLYYT